MPRHVATDLGDVRFSIARFISGTFSSSATLRPGSSFSVSALRRREESLRPDTANSNANYIPNRFDQVIGLTVQAEMTTKDGER